MRVTTLLALLALSALPILPAAGAQETPTGRWTSIDDATGKPKSIVEIYEARDGNFAGRVAEVLDMKEGPNPLCVKCGGANKDKPIKGMVILWGLKPDGAAHWSGGRVLDPENGKTYKSKLELMDGGRKLGMSGCIAFFCRQQVWIRQ
ncbi:MAG: DUF2147 domain-containing protein [Thermomonas sp.]